LQERGDNEGVPLLGFILISFVAVVGYTVSIMDVDNLGSTTKGLVSYTFYFGGMTFSHALI
jgi:choline-glycine betaine transporter